MFKFINEQGCRGRRGMQWHISKSIVGASKIKWPQRYPHTICALMGWRITKIIPNMNDKRRKVT
jgi:hypothetical protein